MISIETLKALTIEEAAICLCSLVESDQYENVGLTEARGRILADDFITPFAMPPFRRAAMDGYAVQFEDIAKATPEHPVTLRIVDEIKAGSSLPFIGETEDRAKTIRRIYTGAPVPEQCDTIIVQEAIPLQPIQESQPMGASQLVEASDPMEAPQEMIEINKPFRQGKHIAEAGEDMAFGTVALTRGAYIGAKEIAMLASYGQSIISVYQRPRVTVIPIGDELLTPGEELESYRIYDANSFMVEARVCELGALVKRCEPVPDEVQAIAVAIKHALSNSDIVITTGGISVGRYDCVAQAVEAVGGSPLFRKVLMRPGKPTSAFEVGEQLIIGLSGNPSACFAGLELLVKPVIFKLVGRRSFYNQYVKGTLTSDVTKPCPFTRFIRARAYFQGEQLLVEPLGNDKSGNIAAFSRANALAVIPPGNQGAAKEERVDLLLLDPL